MVKVKDETMLTILSFARILYLKQQSNILYCVCSLKFEKSIFRSTWIVYTAKKIQ